MRLPGKLGRETRVLCAGESALLEEGSLRVGNLRLDEAVAHRARHFLVERGAQACKILRRENRLDRQSRIRLEAGGLERRVHRIAQAFLLPNALPTPPRSTAPREGSWRREGRKSPPSCRLPPARAGRRPRHWPGGAGLAESQSRAGPPAVSAG